MRRIGGKLVQGKGLIQFAPNSFSFNLTRNRPDHPHYFFLIECEASADEQV